MALRPEWSTWELTKQLRRNMRFFWPRAESQIYGEAKALVDKGLARSRRTFVGTRPRTTYQITAAGRRALQAWLATPPKPTSLQCEPLLRVFLADFATPQQLRAAIAQVRADAEAVLEVGRVVGAEYLAGTAPFQHQVHVRTLVFDFLTSHAMALREWAERADRAVDHWDDPDRDCRARDAIGRLLERYPEVTGASLASSPNA